MTAPYEPQTRQLRRRLAGRMLGGVAAGLAEYLDLDPAMVRIALVALSLVGGVAVPLYLAAWLLIPAEDAATSIAEDRWAKAFSRGGFGSGPAGSGSGPAGFGSGAAGFGSGAAGFGSGAPGFGSGPGGFGPGVAGFGSGRGGVGRPAGDPTGER